MTRRKPGAVIGRPKGPPNPTARIQSLNIRVNAADLALLDRVAADVEMGRGETLREALRRWARDLGMVW